MAVADVGWQHMEDLGRAHMARGDFGGAAGCFKEALATAEALTPPAGGAAAVDLHLVLAEALWQEAFHAAGKGTRLALPHYEAAAALARAEGDVKKESMVALGHGYALAQLHDAEGARERLGRARALAEADGNRGALQFVDRLLEQVGAPPPVEGPKAVLDTWRQFAESFASSKPGVLFCRGSVASPADDATQRAVTKLRGCGCLSVETVDILVPGPGVPDGLQSFADSPHLTLPQLFVGGMRQEGWEDLTQEQLRDLLGAAGLKLSEPPPPEPCHGAGAFADGLEPWQVALVEIVSKEGARGWPDIAAQLLERGFADDLPRPADGKDVPGVLEAAWRKLAPSVKEKLERQEDMPCGHSCSTCPTRHDCQLHDAVDGELRAIEDLA